jgi:hypothetical protein
LVVLDEGSLHTVQTLVDVAVLIRVTTPSTTENGRPARTVAFEQHKHIEWEYLTAMGPFWTVLMKEFGEIPIIA